jgi:hypothetical protein
MNNLIENEFPQVVMLTVTNGAICAVKCVPNGAKKDI